MKKYLQSELRKRQKETYKTTREQGRGQKTHKNITACLNWFDQKQIPKNRYKRQL